MASIPLLGGGYRRWDRELRDHARKGRRPAADNVAGFFSEGCAPGHSWGDTACSVLRQGVRGLSPAAVRLALTTGPNWRLAGIRGAGNNGSGPEAGDRPGWGRQKCNSTTSATSQAKAAQQKLAVRLLPPLSVALCSRVIVAPFGRAISDARLKAFSSAPAFGCDYQPEFIRLWLTEIQ
jgi:hypothetical protein